MVRVRCAGRVVMPNSINMAASSSSKNLARFEAHTRLNGPPRMSHCNPSPKELSGLRDSLLFGKHL